mmetsp:Transcript_116917/g.268284  ORF Transcript_116917/g.268284 Transcript_116917/m.268284 type:complete len:1024 (-) Transcript_116917:118-3189(-)
MEAAHLRRVLVGGHSPDPTERHQAEAFLKSAEGQPGFPTALLQTVLAPDAEEPIKQAAAISFKQTVKKNWTPEDERRAYSAAEQQFVRDNILTAVVRASSVVVRNQLEDAMKAMILEDFPERWPNLFQEVVANLNSNDVMTTYGGLMALRHISWKYSLKLSSDRAPFEATVTQIFPTVLKLAGELLQHPSEEASLMLKVICRIYWFCTQTALMQPLREPTSAQPWMQLMKEICMRPIPPGQVPDDLEAREKCQHYKCKKWALRIAGRFFARYGQPRQARDPEFAEYWLTTFSAGFVEVCLSVLRLRHEGMWLTKSVVHCCLTYLTESADHATTWAVLKPQVKFVLFEVVWPLLWYSEEEFERWQEDPVEYVRQQYDCNFTTSNAREAAKEFLKEVVKVRQQDCFMTVLQQAHTDLEAHRATPTDVAAMRRKDAALMVVGELAERLINSDPQMAKKQKPKKGKAKSQKSPVSIESMLVTYVLSDFASANAFLRFRACWVYQKYGEARCRLGRQQPDQLVEAFKAVLACAADPELPVRAQASMTLRFFLEFECEPVVQVALTSLGVVFERVLGVMVQMDSEQLVATLMSFVEHYKGAIVPYAAVLLTELSSAILRMLRDPEDQEAANAAQGSLQTVTSILESCTKSPEIFPAVEPTLYNLLDRLMTPEFVDYMEEGLDMLQLLTFFSNPISERLWLYFPRLHQCICGGSFPAPVEARFSGGWASDQMKNLLAPLENFIGRGKDVFLVASGGGVAYKRMIFAVVEKVLFMEKMALLEPNASYAAKLLVSLFEYCPGSLDEEVAPAYAMLWRRWQTAQGEKLRGQLLLALITILNYNPALFLRVSEESQTTQLFFKDWFAWVKLFDTAEMKKSMILALTQLVSLGATNQLPSVLTPTLPTLAQTLATQAVAQAQLRRDGPSKKAWDGESSDGLESDSQDLADDEDKDVDVPVAGRRITDVDAFLDGDSDVEDDDNAPEEFRISPLSSIDELQVVKTTLEGLPAPAQQQFLGWLGPEAAQSLQASLVG